MQKAKVILISVTELQALYVDGVLLLDGSFGLNISDVFQDLAASCAGDGFEFEDRQRYNTALDAWMCKRDGWPEHLAEVDKHDKAKKRVKQ